MVLHRRSIAEFGGASGLRDPALLASAISRPLNRFHYSSEENCAALAAAYAFGIARNHPFVDGNKRTAFAAMEVFLILNGWRLSADDADVIQTFLALASGAITETQLADWIEANCTAVA